MRLFQLRDIVIEAARMKACRCMEAMAATFIPRPDALDLEINDFGCLCIRAEATQNGLQRTHPAQGAGLVGGLAPPHAFGPRKRADD